MKFNWGIGIFIFLILFLGASAAFIIFALRQDVNLVHKDYYEKGVDYSDQMAVISRSEPYKEKILSQMTDNSLLIELDSVVSSRIDSGKVYLYRPSDSKFDLEFPLKKKTENIRVPVEKLIGGRYILQVSWYSDGLKYEVDGQILVEK